MDENNELTYLEKFILGMYGQIISKLYRPCEESHKNVQALCFIINKYFYTNFFPVYFWKDNQLYSPELEVMLNNLDKKLNLILDYYKNYDDESFYELYPFYLESKFDDINNILKDYIKFNGDLNILSTLIFLNSVDKCYDYNDANTLLENNLISYNDEELSMKTFNCMNELDNLNSAYVLEIKPSYSCISY